MAVVFRFVTVTGTVRILPDVLDTPWRLTVIARHFVVPLAVVAISLGIVREIAAQDSKGGDVVSLLLQLESAKPKDLPALVHMLGALGPNALPETKAARTKAKDERIQRALDHAITWQAAARVTKTLRAAMATQLTFDGQYAEFKKDRELNLRALFALLDDESTAFEVRIVSCRGIADIADKKSLPRLRELHSDLLLPPSLREEIGILLAIFGDTHAVDAEFKEYSRFRDSKRPEVRLSANLQLANLYYRVRNYERAVASYETILKTSNEMYEMRRRAGLPKQFLTPLKAQTTLHYYNAACSNSLHGNLEQAKKYLREAVEGNPEHFENIDKDGDLINLRKHASYKKFKAELAEMFEEEEL